LNVLEVDYTCTWSSKIWSQVSKAINDSISV